MNGRLTRTLLVVGMVLLFASACSKTPTQPSIDHFGSVQPPPVAAVTLLDLSGRFMGVIDQLCGAGGSGLPIEDLTLNYEVSGTSIANAMIVACDSPSCDTAAPLGNVTECPVPPDPCAAGMADAIKSGTAPVCLAGDPTGSGSLHLLAARPSESAALNVRAIFEDTGEKSNVVSAALDQPQDQAVMANDEAIRSARFVHRARRVHR